MEVINFSTQYLMRRSLVRKLFSWGVQEKNKQADSFLYILIERVSLKYTGHLTTKQNRSIETKKEHLGLTISTPILT